MMPIAHYTANPHRKSAKNGPGKDPDRAAERAAQPTAIDADRDCPWPLDWQRHYRVLADLADADSALPHIAPGVVFDGDDIGKWLRQQKQPATWARLLPKQQARLTALGVQPDPSSTPAPAASRGAGRGPARHSRRSSAAWRPSRSGWSGKAPTATARAPRARRDHGRRRGGAGDREARRVGLQQQEPARQLTQDQLEALRKLGVDWA
ncbi:helicase associated domain-containing protein [Streptomyces sp. NPDC002467]|uniref:helicase associated domain-containing protein n=1 Tax=Streptomyces sp. NPDC002467 TaxID=3364647 RepID=UPI00367C27B7